MVIFRENTEDIYAGIEFEKGTEDNAKFAALLKENFPERFGKVRFLKLPAMVSNRYLKKELTELLKVPLIMPLLKKEIQ